MSNPVVQDARGTILDEADDWKIIAFPFRKFFNVDESNAVKINWGAGVKVFEKLDGSLMILYFYRGEWHVATSGKPDAAGWCYAASRHKAAAAILDQDANDDEDIDAEKDAVDTKEPAQQEKVSYKDVFWQLWKASGYPVPGPEDQNKCFMFELVSSANRVVCHYDTDGIYLHGARDLTTMKEVDPEPFAAKYNWKMPAASTYHSQAEVIEAAKRVNAVKCEGFVVVDKNFNRIKVKSPVYVQIALLQAKDTSGMNEKRIISIIQMGESEEFLSYFPQWTELYERVKNVLDTFADQLQTEYDEMKDLDNQKEFVAAVKNLPNWKQTLLFGLKKGTWKSAKDCLRHSKDLLGLYKKIKDEK